MKFRVWSKNKQSFVDYIEDHHYREFYLHLSLNGGLYAFSHRSDVEDKELDFDDKEFVVQQYIGIDDKNHDPIFEGDIVQYTERMCDLGDAQTLVAKVMYDPEVAAFGLGDKECWNYFTDQVIYNFEVVGNIFEPNGVVFTNFSANKLQN